MALFYNNHDQPRVVSRFGDDKKYHKESAKMLATSIHMLRGIPYIYQGEEFGMTNAYFTSIHEYRDVESTNYYEILRKEGLPEERILEILQAKSRDNGRTPVLWNDEEGRGFTEGTPWIPFAKGPSVSAEKDMKEEDSIFSYYQKLIELRKTNPVIQEGTYEILEKEHPSLFCYVRALGEKKVLVLNNFYDKEEEFSLNSHGFPPVDEKKVRLLLTNYNELCIKDEKICLRPYESVVIGVEP